MGELGARWVFFDELFPVEPATFWCILPCTRASAIYLRAREPLQICRRLRWVHFAVTRGFFSPQVVKRDCR
jgi:hypothetical protein